MAQDLQNVLERGVETVFPSKLAFEKALGSGKKLTIYNGIDPTASSLHLGHLVVLKKLRQFQDLDHKIILLFGDFTAMIGDPSGKLQARKAQTRAQVLANVKDYKNQAAKILNFSGKNPAEIRFNSAWLSKLSFEEIIQLASHFTTQQLLERDMFQKRVRAQKPIYLPELIYPLLQGYDSVAMKVDVEVGGSDQMFNMLVGRELVKKYLGKEKFVLTTKLLTVGEVKMGKTESVFTPLSLPPSEMFGKIMALPDDAMPSFFELLTDLEPGNFENLLPLEAKKLLAKEILKQLFAQSQVGAAQREFESVFQKRGTPTTMTVFKANDKTYSVVEVLAKSESVSSRSQAKRLVEQGAIEIDGKVVKSSQEKVGNREIVIKIGKRKFLKILP
ncbi:tyrosine--tRNA ligase [Candidatus Curtissbacteria bacterium RBG_16_39_7]|uniref:Tyrosine--tRNA ligase n=1 Tax=Candidatus Curtissbacteria bacterium RBG_16_39_7 TaxID=1797707 RepID=A0A1F5G2X9_9BACT|nr:MAG: tyrosine--tRNA ligase [Candidatus Curtissbacteria bacterium RBG_16_39_7]